MTGHERKAFGKQTTSIFRNAVIRSCSETLRSGSGSSNRHKMAAGQISDGPGGCCQGQQRQKGAETHFCTFCFAYAGFIARGFVAAAGGSSSSTVGKCLANLRHGT